MVLMALSNKMIARYLLLNKTGGVLMRVDCGHWTDTSSICHTVCQQQAPQDEEEDDDGVNFFKIEHSISLYPRLWMTFY